MRRIVCLVCVIGIVVSALAQNTSLCVTTDKTTSLIFPFAIKHVDRGSQNVLVLPVKEANNILLVKAATADFNETNLSVVIDDGSVYSFAVSCGNAATWVYKIPVQNAASISTYANGLLDNPRTTHRMKDASWDMLARVSGIYIKNETVYYQLNLQNDSPIDYDINYVRFYIRDKKRSKRTASQETEINPLYVAGNTSQVKANSQSTIVVALGKFTIPDAKYLAIEIREKNGGRNLLMKVGNNKILRAIPLPDFK